MTDKTPSTPGAPAPLSAPKKRRTPVQKKLTVKKQPPRPAWRPTLLSKKMADQIAVYIHKGYDYKTAAELSGISKRTFHNWCKNAEDVEAALYEMYEEAGDDVVVEMTEKQELLLYFLSVVGRAKGRAKAAAIDCVMRNCEPVIDLETGLTVNPGDHKAAIEYLRRRDPENWGDVDKRELTIKADEETKEAIRAGVIQVPTAAGLSHKELSEAMQKSQAESMMAAKEKVEEND